MTLPAHDHGARRTRVREQLDALGIDALVVTHGVDVRWLTGLVSSNAQVLLCRDGDDVLLTDDRYAQMADDLGVTVSLQSWVAALGDAAVAPNAARVGIQGEHVVTSTHARLGREAPSRELVVTTDVLALARRHKDVAELARLELACDITSRTWEWLVDQPIEGRTEAAIARSLVRHLEDLGADGPAFAPIVAGGPNSAVPHHHPTDRPVARGDLLKVDFGALVEGYHADCTRVLAVGDPGQRLREVHAAVLEAQQRGVDAAVAGATAGAVHDAAVGHLEGLDLGPTLHGVGHGVGLEIHETPILSSEPTATLESGFVVTVEPGIYLAGVGGVRIEDTVAVTSDGPRRLTDASHELHQQ